MRTTRLEAGQLERARLRQVESRERLADILVEEGMLNTDEVLSAVAKQLGLPYRAELALDEIDDEYATRAPISFAKQHRLLPISGDPELGTIHVVAADPLDTAPIDDLRMLFDGAEIILGPLMAKSVIGVTPVARQARVPVLAFSNDTQVAGNGVYLMSVLPEQEVHRIVAYAASRGKRRFAALIPDTAYGRVVESAFRRAVERAGGSVAIVEKYPPGANGMLRPTKRVVEAIRTNAAASTPVDALFLPGGQEVLPQIGPVVAYSGLDTTRVQLLGTGAWDFPSIGRDSAFVGGWYASPDPVAWRSFAERFATTFGSTPPRIASVAYDAMSLAINLSSNPPGTRFTPGNLTRKNGFAGVDGIVRLESSGLSQRALAVLEVQTFGATVIDPAPHSFYGTQLSSAQ